MRVRMVEAREGEDMGPIDWDHLLAKDMPPTWREAEGRPGGFVLVTDTGTWEIYSIRMYDGWPYWKPTPAILRRSPLGGSEWTHFNSYGVRPNSIVRRAAKAA